MTLSAVPLRLENVEKSFGPVQALAPLTLDVRAGEFLTILGSSGSGKTTLLNIVAGYLACDRGRLVAGTRDITNTPARARNIGMVFQNYALFPNMNVFENVAYGLRVRGKPKAEVKATVEQILRSFQLDGFGERAISQLSGGQQQRVALARALVIEPALLLMDEPLGALDRQLRKHLQLEIRRRHLAAPRTTLYVTHDQEEALTMSDRVAIMSGGRVEQIGTPQELYKKPVNAFVARFLGESNLFPVRFGSGRWILQDGNPDASSSAQASSQLLVRPEHIRLCPVAEGRLVGTISERIYLGELEALSLRTNTGAVVMVRTLGGAKAALGEAVGLDWDDADAHVLKSEAAAPTAATPSSIQARALLST